MKTVYNALCGVALATLAAPLFTSCVSDDPFMGAGDAEVRMRFVINSDVTRAEVDDEDLRSNCVVYISSEKGLIHKYKGLENVPEVLKMKCGSYVAEAWTGDSVPASFDKKFYRGYMPFTVEKGVNSPVLKCGIANVVASVNAATIDPSMMSDYTITIGHKNASLDFTAENVADAKGYYMLPNGETNLTYTIKGVNSDGKNFEKSGIIMGKGPDGALERAHEYVLNFTYNPEYEAVGGAFVTVTIDDHEVLIEDEIEILGRPTVAGVAFDLSRQLVGNEGAFDSKVIKISGFGGIKSLVLNDENGTMGLPANRIDLVNLTDNAAKEIAELGIIQESIVKEDKNLTVVYLTFDKKFLNSLKESTEEYRLAITAIDNYNKQSDAVFRIAVGEGAVIVEDPVTVEPVDQENDMMSVGSKSVRLYFNINDESAQNVAIEYRPASASDDQWQRVSVENAVSQLRRRANTQHRVPAKRYQITLNNLNPDTRYAYRIVAEGYVGATNYVTTEKCFTIPNASLEEWSSWSENSKVILPAAGGVRSFWDTGNHGSSTMNVTLTQSSSDMVASGSLSARLRSQFVGLGGSIGKFAAGNLFVGEYAETKGTNGVINFGRPYDGSHPKALKVECHYRPGVASGKGANSKYIPSGATDKGQIYIALSTTPVKVDTSDENQLFKPEASCIVAYGQVTFEENFGPDGGLATVEIPFNYYDRARNTRPLYLIIVCTASKYGDYFSGGEGSLMYLDDFELVY